MDTWLLIVDYMFQTVSPRFLVDTTSDNNVHDLKEKIKGRLPVDPIFVSVWRTKGSLIINKLSYNYLPEILNAGNKNVIKELDSAEVVVDLGLSDGETLLLRLPEMSSVWPPRTKRKPDSDDEYLGRLKSRKLANIQPDEVNDHSKYSELQIDRGEKILDDRPGPDLDIPPLPLLYRGFGHFLDSTSLAGIQSGNFTFSRAFKRAVNELVDEVCTIENVHDKRDYTADLLFEILFPGSEVSFDHLLDQSQRATDAYIPAAHGGPLLIVDYKREMESAEPQVAGSFLELAKDARQEICRGWRQPAHGLIIRGSYISFVGLVMIDTQVRILPLTPAFPCNDSAFQSRVPLYAAFSAARDLLRRIEKDSEEFVKSPAPETENPVLHKFPNIQSLRRFPCNSRLQEGQDRINFEITASLGDGVKGRFLYVAQTQSKPILVKFSRTYSTDLHDFCFSNGYAPELLAFEELAGGWLGIAMEYFPSAICVDDSPSRLVQHGETWLKKMDEMVEMLHKCGYVHGDLQASNFITDGERLMLIDFDMGGKEGQATFPDDEVLPILSDSQDETLIQQSHDRKVLADTKEMIVKRMRVLVKLKQGVV